MDSTTEKKRNPFLLNELNSLCIACNGKLKNAKAVPIQEILPHITPTITLFEALKLVSNFGEFNQDNIPQRACNTCFHNIDGFLRFQGLCNRSVENIKAYILHQEQEDIKYISPSANCVASSCDDTFKEEYPNDIVLDEPPEAFENPDLENSNVSSNESENNEQNNISGNKEETGKSGVKTKKRKMMAGDRIECKYCHKLFRRDYMKYHLNIHTGEQPHKCKICDATFGCPRKLYSHTKYSHSAGYPHLCSICGRAFKINQALKLHVRCKHTNERPYVCETCGKTFKTSRQRKEHYTTHSDERTFQCEKCPKMFPSRKYLKQHSVTHAEVRPFECEFCGKRFTQRHCMRSHQAKTCEAMIC